MKFANVHSVITSSRFALRLAFFSFVCLMVFAMSGTRFGIAPVAGAGNTTRAVQSQKRPAGKAKTGAARRQAVVRETGKSEDKGAAGKSAGGDVRPSALCTQNQPISFNQTTNGTLANGDCLNPIEGDGSLVDEYTFNGTAGQQVTISMSSTDFDTVLYLLNPAGAQIAFNDDIDRTTTPPNRNSRIVFTLTESGNYSILANSFAPEERGAYTISLATTGTCNSTPINFNQTLNGTLTAGDCTNDIENDGTFVDLYTFSGTAGQQIAITMTSTSGATLDPYLYLLTPSGDLLADNDDGGGGTTARIPQGVGFGRLPVTGTYTIMANTVLPSQSGNYSLNLVRGTDCASIPVTSGSTVNGALANGDCRLLEDGSFIDAYTFSGSTNGQVTITMTSSSPGLVPVLFLLSPDGEALAIDVNNDGDSVSRIPAAGSGSFTLPATGTYTVLANSFEPGQTGNYSLNIISATGCTYAIYPTVRPFTANSSTSGRFTVITQSGCPWSAASLAPWITITEGGSGTTGTGRVRYTVQANNTTSTRIGTISINGNLPHTVTQTSPGTTPQIQFSGNAEFTVNENDPSRGATITVTRTGDTTGAATVEYATLDDPAAVPCDPSIKNGDAPFPQGIAYARCDYATTLDTLTFNAGETVKTFRIPLINDVFQESTETFAISLFNPQGATLGTLASGTVRIQSDDLALPTTNPINQTAFFVRQQYLDFLDREPESGEPWSAVLARCGNIFTGPEVITDCDRIAVSGAFFGSPEFRIKGFSVFLHYKAAFGSANNPLYVPEYGEFVRDARRVSGTTAEEVIAKRLDFSEDFLARPTVASVFAGTTNEGFVDRVLSNLGITLANADPATGETRNTLVNSLNTGTRTRAEVFRIIVDSTEAIAAQFNRAFVAIQYYGYLRRTPEATGYQANLNALNATNNSRRLIDGFLNSIEYRLRFGANTTNP